MFGTLKSKRNNDNQNPVKPINPRTERTACPKKSSTASRSSETDVFGTNETELVAKVRGGETLSGNAARLRY